jgi:DinB superfamily
MDTWLKEAVWHQLGAAIDTLENTIRACPEELWRDRSREPEYGYLVFHTLFFLDFYLADSPEGFAPPAPFTLDELDPAGVLPERVYTQDELLTYLEFGRAKARSVIEALTEEKAREPRLEGSFLEQLLYTLRHVQHHAAQLNLILRRETGSATQWVKKAKSG